MEEDLQLDLPFEKDDCEMLDREDKELIKQLTKSYFKSEVLDEG